MSSKIYVGNLSWNTNDNTLRDAFGQFGQVLDSIVMTDRETGRSRGFGFVTFGSQVEADTAVSNMNDQELDGRREVEDLMEEEEEEDMVEEDIMQEEEEEDIIEEEEEDMAVEDMEVAVAVEEDMEEEDMKEDKEDKDIEDKDSDYDNQISQS
ncbi:hypothetical protein BGZ58_002778 [Dissophora ornata]|nr:hypothetical protein BGZ58_002778 [Dissophora ornata]